MNEQENKPAEKPGTTEDSREGDKSKTVETLDRADQIVERQKRENDRREEILIREEQLQSRKAVGGESEAGQEEPTKKKETPAEYRKRIEQELADGKHR